MLPPEKKVYDPVLKKKLSGAFDIETVLCSGTPRTHSKNLAAMTGSTLSAQFERKRISRQRIGRILRRETQPDRFDLITLLFLVYAVTVEPEWPNSRYMQYIDEINEILARCHMMGIYPVNPYESFVLMCLLTEEPLSTYNDVWELSFL